MPVCELDSSGNVIATNTFGTDGLVSRTDSSGSKYYTFDPNGNVTQIVDNSGNVVATLQYDAYGKQVASTGANDTPYGFGGQAGYYTDSETGLSLATYRYYDPNEGRWLTRDPIGYLGGMDLYAYCDGNPVGAIDPSGLDPEDEELEAYYRQTNPAYALNAAFTTNGNNQRNKDLKTIGANSDYAFKNPVGIDMGKFMAQKGADIVMAVSGVGDAEALAEGACSLGEYVLEFHHLLPNKPELAEKFAAVGIDDLDSYVVRMWRGDHRLINYKGLHTNVGGNWNAVWEQFFDYNSAYTAEDVFNKLGEMIDQFDIVGKIR